MKKAFTLLEVLVVLGVISILIVVLNVSLNAPHQKNNEVQAKADMTALVFAVNSIGLKNQTYDIDLDLFAAHINAEMSIDMRVRRDGEVIKSTEVLDPWDNEYEIKVTFPENTNGLVTIRSFGPDRKPDTSDDIVSTVTYDTTNGMNQILVSE